MSQCANFERDILARKVRLLYSHFPGGAAVNLSVSLGIFLMFMPTMPGLKLYLWFAGSVAVVFLRTADYLMYRHSGLEGISDARSWCLRFAAGSTAQGILWGVAGFFLFPSSNLSHQFMLTIILCGMAGGAIIFLSPVYFVYLLYLFPTLLPASIRILMQEGDGYFIVGMLGPVYLLGMSYASWRTSRWLDTSLRLVLEKETIASALKKAHEQLELRVSERTADLKTANENLKQEMEKKNQAEYALTTEKERLSVTLRSIAEGVMTTDIDGKIIFLNKVAEDLTEWRQKDAVGRDLNEIFHIINTLTGKRWGDPFSLIFRSEQINSLADHTMLIAKNGNMKKMLNTAQNRQEYW
jgi:PAS domain-containing protein